jgi:hypothetical protein
MTCVMGGNSVAMLQGSGCNQRVCRAKNREAPSGCVIVTESRVMLTLPLRLVALGQRTGNRDS